MGNGRSSSMSEQDLKSCVDSLRSTKVRIEKIIVKLQPSDQNVALFDSHSQVKAIINQIETEVQQLDALIPHVPAAIGYGKSSTSEQDLKSCVDSLRSIEARIEKNIVKLQPSDQNVTPFDFNSKVKAIINKIETEVQQLDALIPHIPAAPGEQTVSDGRYSVFTNRHIVDTITMLSSKDLRFVNATDDKDLLSCLQTEFPKLIVKLFTSDEPLAAFDNVVVFGRYQSRIETDSNEALDHIPEAAYSKAVLIMFHQTRGSKTKDDVFEVTYKHKNVQDQLHIPFRKNSD